MLKKIEPYKNNKSTAMRNQNVLYFLIITGNQKYTQTQTKENTHKRKATIPRNYIEKQY